MDDGGGCLSFLFVSVGVVSLCRLLDDREGNRLGEGGSLATGEAGVVSSSGEGGIQL